MKLRTTHLVACMSTFMLLGLTACGGDDSKASPNQPVTKPVIQHKLEVVINANSNAETFNTLSFSAQASGIDNTKNVNYSWNFGDDSSATGTTTEHIYGNTGDYTVTLTATDSTTKQTVTVSKQITITEKASSNEAPVMVKVTDTDNKAVSDLTVKVAGETQSVSGLGFATADSVSTMDKTLISAAAVGYITQSIQLEPNKSADTRSVAMTLKQKSPTQPITDIKTTNNVNYQDMTVSFEGASFVTADGKPAIGKADVSITQWDPTNQQDMSAFLGDGVAIDNTGAYAQLQSYGAMTVEFTQNGEKLQLAPGKYAKISMPLSLTKDYDGSDMKVGDKIPMWHFAESTGAWIQEADLMGTVVADASGELMLEAQVSHFTTWNWDMKFENPNSMVVKCQMPDGTATACSISATFQYPNNGRLATKQNNISATDAEKGVDIINIDPNLAEVTFTAGYFNPVTSIYYTGHISTNPKNSSLIVVLDNQGTIDASNKITEADHVNVICNIGYCNVYAVINYIDLLTGYTSTKYEEIYGSGTINFEPTEQITSITFERSYDHYDYDYDATNVLYKGSETYDETTGIPSEIFLKCEEYTDYLGNVSSSNPNDRGVNINFVEYTDTQGQTTFITDQVFIQCDNGRVDAIDSIGFLGCMESQSAKIFLDNSLQGLKGDIKVQYSYQGGDSYNKTFTR